MYRLTAWALLALLSIITALLLGRVAEPYARISSQIGIVITFVIFPYCVSRTVQLLFRSRVQSYSGLNSIVGESSPNTNPPVKVPAAQARWTP